MGPGHYHLHSPASSARVMFNNDNLERHSLSAADAARLITRGLARSSFLVQLALWRLAVKCNILDHSNSTLLAATRNTFPPRPRQAPPARRPIHFQSNSLPFVRASIKTTGLWGGRQWTRA